ncbi:cyclic nucleotide-binding protein [Capnocytophaga sp. HP1101]
MNHELLLNKIREYITLSGKECALVEELFEPLYLTKGEVLLEEGKVCRHFCYVKKGLLRQFINYDGKELTIHFNEEDTFVCDFESFITKTPSQKTITAVEDSVLQMISYDNLQRFYKEIKEGERFGRLLLEETFIKAIQHIISGLSDSPQERYLKFMKLYRGMEQRVAQKYIASFVGVTPQSLSRIRRRIAHM